MEDVGFASGNTVDDKFKAVELDLRQLDKIFTTFARKNSLTLRFNAQRVPSRSLWWESSSLRRHIQLFLSQKDSLLFDFWLSASERRDNRRFIKKLFLVRNEPISFYLQNLPALLEDGFRINESWESSSLIEVERKST